MRVASLNNCRKHQAGVSLIGLLVGLLISMLCILALLTLYKNLVQVSATTQEDTLFDGKMATTLLAIQKATHAAGYGIADADASNIVANDTGTKLQLLWRSLEGGVHRCRGLEETTVTDGGISYREVYFVNASAGCNATDALTAASWAQPSPRQVLARWRITDTLNDYLTNTHSNLLQFSFANKTCAPYGAADDANLKEHRVMTVAAPNSAVLHGAAVIARNTFEFCLNNISTGTP